MLADFLVWDSANAKPSRFQVVFVDVCLDTLKIRTLGEYIPPSRHIILSKWEIPDYFFFLYSGSDFDHSQN